MLPISNTLVGRECVHISFHVDIENEILVMNQECQLLFFRLRETSSSENQSLSWRSRAIQVTVYESYYMISVH